MKRTFRTPKGLTIALAILVFLIITVTMCLTSGILVLLYKADIITMFPQPSFRKVFMGVGFLSIIIATVLTLVLGNFPLKPIRNLIDATKELSKGNFDVRINLNAFDELRELSDSFNTMAEELGSTEMLRSDFINNFSHEFKTPIVSLKGFAKLLKDDNLSKEERDEYLDIIISESERLSTLATNVLNLTNIENKKIITEKKTFDLTESIRRSILLFEARWNQKQIDLDIELEEINYFSNEELLNQVWVNLIDNAIKFTQYGQKIEVSLFKEENNIVFKIKDYGCGMREDTIKHIFDKFYQGEESHSVQGNGLGLSVVERIIELFNGKVEVNSRLGEGTEFLVKLPL